ncbi:MAG: enoyl-CoA hydratase-related protein, partial [Alphaproteobacteria bacterium]|nr:enoyl-CoA hydratase-related protein [Alphaproteobacteria bacterium]
LAMTVVLMSLTLPASSVFSQGAAGVFGPDLVPYSGKLEQAGQNVSAERALALGLINRVVADDQVIDEARRMAAVLAGFDAGAIRATKRVFQTSTELNLPQSLDAAREVMLLMRELGTRD